MEKPAPATADTNPENWVDAFAPPRAVPWLRLMRADRPIGTWLLFLPCMFGMGLALSTSSASYSSASFSSAYFSSAYFWQVLYYVILFAIGAFVMRGAGCVYNDITDRDIDAKVARTALRPIPSGQVSVKNAWKFLMALCLIGLLILLQFNFTTIILGIGSLGLVAAYPFMKRITHWPQLWLGLTFNWGVLMGYSAIKGYLSVDSLLIYTAGIFWTLGYDTIYAHQDKEDDALIGVKSTALRLGANTKPWLAGFYGAVILMFATVLLRGQYGVIAWVALVPAIAHFAYQIRTLDVNDGHKCLNLFKANKYAGLFLLLPFMLAML